MARGRMISKSLSTSEKFALLADVAGQLGEFSQSLYPLVVVHTDDFGRLHGDAFTIKHTCFPTSPRSVAEFSMALTHLHDVGLICLYQVEGKSYLQISAFELHQIGLNKRTASKIPEVPGSSQKFPLNRTELELNRTKQKGTKDKNSGVPPQALSAVPRMASENVKVITKIAHEVLKQHNGHKTTGADLCDEIKTLCATRKIAYDTTVIRKALDSAEVQRKAARN